jgi:hypothetical protein
MPLEHPRVTLPKNLAETLKRLEDAELVTLFREVTVEIERRDVMKPVNAVVAPRTVPATRSKRGTARVRANRPTFRRGKRILSRRLTRLA